MTYMECISMVDTLNPNRVSNEIKRRWLGELEGRIMVEVEGVSPSSLSTPEEDSEVPYLSVPYPYDRMYWLYVMAMLDFVNGDSARYDNSAAMFNAAYQDYAKRRMREG